MQVVCVASGPSLTPSDCDLVRAWRNASSDRRVHVTNSSFRLCPWADVLYAMDRRWWEVYLKEVNDTCADSVERLTQCALPPLFKTTQLTWPAFNSYKNSGTALISLAAQRGATRVVMLGYDCQYTNQKRHWHENHPRGLGNAGSLVRWPVYFGSLAHDLKAKNVEVLNASRATALKMFPRITLEEALSAA